jgi:hypothetical protein
LSSLIFLSNVFEDLNYPIIQSTLLHRFRNYVTNKDFFLSIALIILDLIHQSDPVLKNFISLDATF